MNLLSPLWSQTLLKEAYQCPWAQQGNSLNQIFELYLSKVRQKGEGGKETWKEGSVQMQTFNLTVKHAADGRAGRKT